MTVPRDRTDSDRDLAIAQARRDEAIALQKTTEQAQRSQADQANVAQEQKTKRTEAWAISFSVIGVAGAVVGLFLVIASCVQRNAVVMDPRKEGTYWCYLPSPPGDTPTLHCEFVRDGTPTPR